MFRTTHIPGMLSHGLELLRDVQGVVFWHLILYVFCLQGKAMIKELLLTCN